MNTVNNKEVAVRGDAVSAVQALRLFENGQLISCPVCETALDSIPRGIAPGTANVMGLICPVNNRHFMIYGESAELLIEARRRLHAIAASSETP